MARISEQAEARFNEYIADVLEANGIADALDPIAIAQRSFAVDPTVQQTLIDRIQPDDGGLMGRFNNFLVDEIAGQKVLLGTDGKVISSTTDTGSNDRKPVNPFAMDSKGYLCTLTDFDVVIPFELLNNWAKFDNFYERLGNWLLKEFKNDRLKIAWNGVSRQNDSDRNANPLGQDVNRGWLQYLRDVAPSQVITEIAEGSGAVTYGAAGDYKTIDQVALSARNELIPAHHRQANDLVVFCNDQLLDDRHYDLVDQDKPTERIAADEIIKRARVGGMPAVAAPFFPENTMKITSYDNLSRYEQEGSRRRKIDPYDPKKRGVVNWEEFNEAFVVEHVEKAALVENIQKA